MISTSTSFLYLILSETKISLNNKCEVLSGLFCTMLVVFVYWIRL